MEQQEEKERRKLKASTPGRNPKAHSQKGWGPGSLWVVQVVALLPTRLWLLEGSLQEGMERAAAATTHKKSPISKKIIIF